MQADLIRTLAEEPVVYEANDSEAPQRRPSRASPVIAKEADLRPARAEDVHGDHLKTIFVPSLNHRVGSPKTEVRISFPTVTACGFQQMT